MKTFADIKRKLVEGATITMVRHDWYPDGKHIGVKRKVIKRKTNAVQFEGGSWLYLDRPAKEFKPLSHNTFSVQLGMPEDNKFMVYEIEDNKFTVYEIGE